MDQKTTAIVSYITLIGWLIAFFTYRGNQDKGSLPSYHLRQSLGLFIVFFGLGIVVNILTMVLAAISPTIAMIFSLIMGLVSLAGLVLMIIGILNANKGEEKPLPIIGKMFEGKFNFIP